MSLRLAGIAVDIAGLRIVSDIDLVVPDGAFVGLLGPNGSGKSTILKTIYRACRPTAGQVLLDGGNLLSMTAKEAACRIAVVAQEFTVEFDFTVLGCEHLSSRSFNTLSGGEKQRVLIARAIAQGADHLILDEPTSHLDIRYQVEILELVARLGITVLAAVHDLSLAALFCDTVYLLANGRIVTFGSPEAVITSEMVRHAYGADVLVIEHPETGTPHLIPRRSVSGT